MANPRRFINRALVQRGAREDRARRMAQIAQTPWGQAWLGALREVDHQNRLARGMELARQGAVEQWTFTAAGGIQARVRGSQVDAYSVRLQAQLFSPAQQGALLAEVVRRPEWLDLLLNGTLPAGIEQVLAQAQVQLFPKSFRDLELHCDCPDTASPCKHLAALLYQLAADMDEDPMLLFRLRGLDLSQQLQQLGDRDGLAPIPLKSLQTLLAPPSTKAESGNPAVPSASSTQPRLVESAVPTKPQSVESAMRAKLRSAESTSSEDPAVPSASSTIPRSVESAVRGKPRLIESTSSEDPAVPSASSAKPRSAENESSTKPAALDLSKLLPNLDELDAIEGWDAFENPPASSAKPVSQALFEREEDLNEVFVAQPSAYVGLGNLALIPALLEHWAYLLPARPPFFSDGNLAEYYLAYLRRASQFWAQADDADEDADTGAEANAAKHSNEAPVAKTSSKKPNSRLVANAKDESIPTHLPAFGLPGVATWMAVSLQIRLDAAGMFGSADLLDAAGTSVHVFTKEIALLSYLERLERDAANASPVAHGAVAEAFRLARRLVVQGAVVPQMLGLGEDRYRIRWQAATQEPSVAEALRRLRSAPDFDASIVYVEQVLIVEDEATYLARLGEEIAAHLEGQAYEPRPAPSYERLWAPSKADHVHALIGMLLRPMLLAGVEEVLAKAEHAAVQLLFFGRPVDLRNAGDTQLALALPLWLRRLSLDTSSHRLLVQIEELPSSPGRYALRPLLVFESAEAPEPVSIAQVAQSELGELLRLQVMRDLALLAEAYAPLQAFLDQRAGIPESIELHGADFAKFLFEVAPALRLVGAQVLLPHGLDQVVRPKLSAVLEATPGDATGAPVATVRPKGLLGLKALIDFNWQVAVGEGALITGEEFADLTDKYEGIVRLRDGFVWLDPQHTSRLLQRLAAPPQPTAAVTLQALLTGTFQGAPLQLSAEAQALRDRLKDAETDEETSQELRLDGLVADLRPYQMAGVRWLIRNTDMGFGSLLADDMGLGKTLQTIAVLEHYRTLGRWQKSPVLVVMPTTLLTNWQRELARFAPGLRVAIYHGPGRRPQVLARAEVILTSYGVLRSDVAKLKKLPWGALVIDEAQQIKNPDAAQTEAVKSIEAPVKIALSGTPIENRLAEYWSVLDFANPGYLGPQAQFAALYAQPIERDRDEQALRDFQALTAPFLLRRLKTDPKVIKDLPTKITQIEPCHLEPEQAALYQQVVETQLRELAEADPSMRQARMLKFMTAVKQVCNHPYHYLKRGSQALEASGKAQRLMELLDVALTAGERVLVFTQYRQMGELLADMLVERLGYRPPFLHGGLDRSERDALVSGMQDGSGPPVLLLSIKAGGTGLNLTAANHVIHYDLWWNPAVESQATDRAYRIGQQRQVHVHRLIVAGTFEEKIDAMLKGKVELAEVVLSDRETH